MIDPTLPLVDLHRHLDGNIRPQTIWNLAHKHNISLPVNSFEQFLPYVQIQQAEADLLGFLKKLDWGVAVLKTLDDCRQVAYENVEDALNAGLDYAELRFSPYYMAMTHLLPIEGVVEAVIDGVTSASKSLNMPINLIGILSRTFGVKACQQELDAILTFKDKIIALDLAGDEFNFPGTLFNTHFKLARDAGLNITIHAGEAMGSESIWQAIEQLGATRIGHGVACQHDDKLLAYMAQNNIAIESCLTSNYQTGTVKNLADHPVKKFLANNLLVCLNTDDPAVENIEIADEYNVASQQLALSKTQLTVLQQNGVAASFLSAAEKKSLLNKSTFNHIKV